LVQRFSIQDIERSAQQDGPTNSEEPVIGGALPQPKEQVNTKIEQGRSNKIYYSDLEDTDEIRLLYLQPRTDGEIISSKLKHARLSDKPKYEALSYMWGPEDVQTEHSVVINNSSVCIRKNLGLALQHLRLKSKTRVLWIDAICINQHEMQERNHQVSQMGSIFKQASRVVVWLGAADNKSRLAFQLFATTLWDYPTIIALLNRKKRLMAIYSVLTRKYWTRLWIIQEFFMARDFVIQCGQDTCSQLLLCSFLDAIEYIMGERHTEYLLSGATPQSEASRIHQTIPARLVRQRRGTDASEDMFKFHGYKPILQPWFKLYKDYKAANCEDQRDRIFGLHSMASDCCKQDIPVDYSLSWQQILGNLVRHQVSQHIIAPKSLKFQDTSKSTIKGIRQIYCEAAEMFSQYDRANLLARLDFAIDDFAERIRNVNPDTVIMISGYIRGRIYHTSPIPSEGFSTKNLSVPHLTTFTDIQLRHICSQLERRDPGSTTRSRLVSLETPGLGIKADPQHPHVTSGLPIFAPINAVPTLARYGFCPGIELPKVKPTDSTTQRFLELLSAAQAALQGASAVLAFEETGLILLAPKCTQIGDLVCQFLDLDVLALLTPDTTIHAYTTRGVNFLAADPTAAADICGRQKDFRREGRPRMDLSMRMVDIKTLCDVSNIPSGKHNIPTIETGTEEMERMIGSEAPQ
jgi:hypothetical protein